MFDQLDLQIPSPLIKIDHDVFSKHQVNVYTKREDLIHSTISGNKWRKLKFNLKQAIQQKASTVVTFGGVFSNHIHATSAACQSLKLPLVIYIRSERIDPQNPTLQFVRSSGAEIRLLSRVDYRQKHSEEILNKILNEFPTAYVIPEGGSNELALQGLHEMSQELSQQVSFEIDHLVVSAGTGCTAAGIIQSVKKVKEIEIYSSLKGDFLIKDIKENIGELDVEWELIQDYHFGGYGRTSRELIEFINDFKSKTEIPLDPIYTGKAMFGLMDRVQKGVYPKESNIIFIHTGGLQGIEGYNYLNSNKPIV